MYELTRAKGFGAGSRRLMIGTCVLSAGYYDAYYVQAQRSASSSAIRQAFGLASTPSPRPSSAAFGVGDEDMQADPVKMYLNDVFTVTVVWPASPASPCPPAGRARPAPRRSSAGPSTRSPVRRRPVIERSAAIDFSRRVVVTMVDVSLRSLVAAAQGHDQAAAGLWWMKGDLKVGQTG